MSRQARPYMAVVANGFARRVGVELAGPGCGLIPAGGTQNGSVERAGSLQFAVRLCFQWETKGARGVRHAN